MLIRKPLFVLCTACTGSHHRPYISGVFPLSSKTGLLLFIPKVGRKKFTCPPSFFVQAFPHFYHTCLFFHYQGDEEMAEIGFGVWLNSQDDRGLHIAV